MTGKQLIVLALLISGIYIYFSFKQISQELSTSNIQTAPIEILNIEEKSDTKIVTEIIKTVKQVETIEPIKVPISVEEKIIEVHEVVQETPIEQEIIKVEEKEIETPIETQSTYSLESEIEDALKGITTSQAIDK